MEYLGLDSVPFYMPVNIVQIQRT